MRLEPWRLAREERDLELDLPLDSFPRLRDLVAGADGPVAIRAHFERDDQGRCRVTGSLAVKLRMRCGNCLEVEPFELRTEIDLCVLSGEDQARQHAPQVDPLILGSTGATPAELFEDDLLLALPDRPCGMRTDCPNRPPEVHEAAGAVEQEEETAEDRPAHPFAVLAGLGKKQDGD